MAIFTVLHGAGDSGWAWHLVAGELRELGHEAVTPDLPDGRDGASWDDCADAVARTMATPGGRARDVVVVGHSAGGYLVPLLARRLGAALQVYVAGLVPRPGETADEWFGAVGWADDVARQAREDGGLTGHADPAVAFYHDVDPRLAEQARARERPADERLGEVPWPGPMPPDLPARYVVTARDRFLPATVQRRVAAERLGLGRPDEIEAGHCVHLSRPRELAGLLTGMAEALPGRS